MRNLMGRLNARSDEELQRIAAAWLLPGNARDRPASIAQLMRAMTDLRATRDFWTRRSENEQQMITSFVADDSDRGSAVAELAAELGWDEAATRTTATRLYQAGVLATTARQQPAPVGETPRLILPRELSQLFARIQDERDAGDISMATPSTLLALLDDADIQRAAEIWGLEAIPGLRTRRELTEGLLELAAFPDRRAMVERTLGWDARRVLGLVAELPAGQTVPLSEISTALELDPAMPRAAERLRNALAELEESLLVWHTWLPGGERGLFQPVWHLAEPEHLQDKQQPPEPTGSEPPERAAGHPAALAWDLLTLLRWLGAGTAAVASLSSASIRARRRLDPLLWNRGGDEPRPGYLEFLTALAESGNLLDPPEPDSNTNRPVRAWRSRSFDDQTAQLLSWWLGAATWIEAQDQEDVVVSGAHWPQFRRRLLVLLAELDSQHWYRLDELARWLSRRSSDALGDAVQIATARPIDSTLDRSAGRLSALERVVERTLKGGFAWFGLIEIGHIPSIGEVVRCTDAGAIAAGVRERETVPEAEGAPITIHPDLTITLRTPSPVRVWSLTAFADQIRLLPESEYRITSRSLERALGAGFRIDDVVTFLERQTGEPLDESTRAQLRTWSESMGRVWLVPALIIQAERDEDLRPLRAPLASAGFQVEFQTGGFVVRGPEGMNAATLSARVESIVREQGKTPHYRADHEALAGEEQAESTGEAFS